MYVWVRVQVQVVVLGESVSDICMPLMCWRMLQRQRFKQQMNQIENIIQTALCTGDNNEIRSQAEAKIYQLARDNYTDFFLSLANIISDQAKHPNTRQSTATVFKRLVSMIDENGTYFWDRVHANSKLNIKDLLLSTLVSNDLTIVRSGANAIATIASIEIAREQWLQILGILSQNCQYVDYNIRRASVVTLGFICQELKTSNKNIDPNSCKQILSSLLVCLQKEDEIIDLALKAIRDSIPFLQQILQNVDHCTKFFQFLFPLLNKPSARPKVYEVMYEFAKYCYLCIGNFLNLIVQFTVAHMQIRDEDSTHALTLWEVIANEYIDRDLELRMRVENQQTLPNYVVMVQQDILSEIMACMLILNKRESEHPEMREAAVGALTAVIECGDLGMVEKVTEGVATILKSSNPGERQASTLMFSCLSNFKDSDEIRKHFKNGFNYFYKLLQDNDLTVVKNTLNGFVTLSERFPEVWLENPEIKPIFSHLLKMAEAKDQDIKLLSLNILINITEVLPRYPEPIGVDPKDQLQQLVILYEKELSKGFNKEEIEKISTVLINLVIGTTNTSLVNELISHLIDKYNELSSVNVQDKGIIHQHYASLIHTCMLAITNKGNLKPTLKDKIFGIIDYHLKYYPNDAEGINVMSAASAYYRKEFRAKLDQYWRYIMNCLTSVEQKALFKATLTCISDISRNHQQFVANEMKRIFQILFDYMGQPIEREIKTDILKCFGDLSLGLKRQSEPYLGKILEIIENCFEAVYTFSKQENEKNYAEELKDSVIELYHCITFALNTQQYCNHIMASHFGNICTFIVRTCTPDVNPTVDYLVHCVYLIYDCALFYSNNNQYKGDVQNILHSNEINSIIKSLQRHRNERSDVSDLLIFIEDKLSARNI